MKRRESLQRLMTMTGGIAVLPAWANAWESDTLPLHKLFTSEEFSTLSSVTDTLIPVSEDGIGAVSLGVDKYLSGLFAECYETSTQDKIASLLQKLNTASETIHGFAFIEGSQLQRQEILEAFSISEEPMVKETFQLVKSETIRGFRTSRVVMTEYYDYIVAPGKFIGCADTDTNEPN
jgi:hypothetical protein